MMKSTSNILSKLNSSIWIPVLGFAISGLLLIFGAGTARATTISVDAYLNSSSGGTGADTGITLIVGQNFSVSADPFDLWSAGPLPRWSNADGLVGELYATGSDESGEVAGTLIGADHGLWAQNGLVAPYGTLVGEIDGNYFIVGTNFSGVAPASGNLSLYYWDCNNGDNTNSVAANIEVNVSSVPEPSSLLLLGTGLAGLLGLHRKRQIPQS